MLDHSWKRWIAENLLLNIPEQEIINIMVRNTIDEQVARRELLNTQNSPYFQAANHFTQLLHKRQSLAMIERELEKLNPNHLRIERREGLNKNEFFESYYTKNRPVILCGLMNEWAARTKWTPEYLKQTCGNAQIEISAQRDSNPSYEIDDSKHRKLVPFREYIDMVGNTESTNDFYITARNNFFKNPDVAPLLKDIVLFPDYLQQDNSGINLWYGAKGTYTPIHHDIMNIFMAQVKGRKHIRMIPPADMDLVYNDDGVYSPVDLRNPDYNTFPKLIEARIIELELCEGEVLFIPVGWWHDVSAFEMSITVSLTNFIFPNHFNFINPMRQLQTAQQGQMHYFMPKDWLDWIDENCTRGCDPKGMIDILKENGFPIDAIKQAMGARFPSSYNNTDFLPAGASSIEKSDYEAIATIPAARLQWMRGFNQIATEKLQLYTLDHFLSDEECDALIHIINTNLRPSTVTTYIEGFRTSYSSDLAPLKLPLVEAIDKKISNALGIQLSYSEGIQAQKYSVGQEFKPHTDYFEPHTKEYEEHASKRGNRTWTFMIYLNRTPKGGGTRFTHIDKTFYPQKGTAVIWNSLHRDGRVNVDTMHWGMPIEEGEKYIITKWFRERSDGPMFYNQPTKGY
jgi:ribosomal protein L16 Arg81 hydroxylase